jgi:cytochrome P450
MLAHREATRAMPIRAFMGTRASLIVGGNDTTRNSMTSGLMALNEHAEEYEKLRGNPGLIPSMIAEVVPYVTPVIHMRRTATDDAELGGKHICKGDKVTIEYVSGKRDSDATDDSGSLHNRSAPPRQHLSFGFGIHHCVGNRPAELQLRILWEELLPRFPVIDVTRAHAPRLSQLQFAAFGHCRCVFRQKNRVDTPHALRRCSCPKPFCTACFLQHRSDQQARSGQPCREAASPFSQARDLISSCD